MAKTSQEIEKEFIEGLKGSTGKDLKAWLGVIKKEGIPKRNDIILWLKTKQSFGHMNASMLAGIFLNNGKPVYRDSGQLLEAQFEKREALRPLYDELTRKIAGVDKEWKFVPTKTYTSIQGKREFAVIAVKSEELRLGMDLGDEAFTGLLQQAKSLGAMPRHTHMAIVQSPADISGKLLALLKKADQRVNGR